MRVIAVSVASVGRSVGRPASPPWSPEIRAGVTRGDPAERVEAAQLADVREGRPQPRQGVRGGARAQMLV
ncbi:hypothetical protein ABZ590_19600, partial [Streptomyces hirsutus]|uniref:hypothetical protein n=1 Tax=Streptomyces hirsutus TaxID=35620 RepID=UPI0033DB3E55